MNPTDLPVLLVCSVEQEAAPIRARLSEIRQIEVASRVCVTGNLDGARVVLLVAGMGKTNAGHALGATLAHQRVRRMIGFGVAGAYRKSGLKPGEIALASCEIYGDEGVLTPAGWISSREIGIPLSESGGLTLYNEFPIDKDHLTWAERRLTGAGQEVVVGPFVTVSCCSGTADEGDAMAERFNAICETMEGAAYAHVAALNQIPFLEVRGISNLVEDRDLSAWRIHEAAMAAADAAATLVRSET